MTGLAEDEIKGCDNCHKTLFKKEAEECENQVERWIYLLKNMETLNRLPWAAQSAVFKKLESIADVSAMTLHPILRTAQYSL